MKLCFREADIVAMRHACVSVLNLCSRVCVCCASVQGPLYCLPCRVATTVPYLSLGFFFWPFDVRMTFVSRCGWLGGRLAALSICRSAAVADDA